jgi:O-antigen/teichoic acid export membrane protein
MTGAALIARGAGVTFVGYAGKVSRPIALAAFSRIYGLDALGVALLVWAWIEVVARVGGLGLDRALQRWIPSAPDEDRPAWVATALMTAALVSLALAGALAAIAPAILQLDDDALIVRIAILVMLPALAVGVTALHAVRGTKQILALVWARSVIEPGAFLVAGLVVAPILAGATAVLVAFMVSVGSVLVVGLVALSRTFGLRRIAAAARGRRLPLGPLLTFALPLGAADVANIALQRGDVLVVGALTGSPATTSMYAIAREIVTSLSKVRQGFDQVLAPIAAELHVQRRRDELATTARMSALWGVMIAAPIALTFLVFPEPVLALFGVVDAEVAIALGVLAVGRLVDVATGPTSVLLAMVGRPRLVLLDAIAGLAVAAIAAFTLGPQLGLAGVALATSAGLVITNLLALYWLDRLEHLRPVDTGLAQPAFVVAISGFVLVALRLALGIEPTPALAVGVALWLAGYVVLVGSLGLLPASWLPWRRAAVVP